MSAAASYSLKSARLSWISFSSTILCCAIRAHAAATPIYFFPDLRLTRRVVCTRLDTLVAAWRRSCPFENNSRVGLALRDQLSFTLASKMLEEELLLLLLLLLLVESFGQLLPNDHGLIVVIGFGNERLTFRKTNGVTLLGLQPFDQNRSNRPLLN